MRRTDALDARVEEAKSERAGLEDAPRVFEEKRHALISEIETAESARRAAAITLPDTSAEISDASIPIRSD